MKALLALAVPFLGMGALLWPHRAELLHLAPPPEKRLLVAVDTASGAERPLRLLDDEKICTIMSTAPAWPELFQIKTWERLDCRAPK